MSPCSLFLIMLATISTKKQCSVCLYSHWFCAGFMFYLFALIDIIILVSNAIPVSDDARVVYMTGATSVTGTIYMWSSRLVMRLVLPKLEFSM